MMLHPTACRRRVSTRVIVAALLSLAFAHGAAAAGLTVAWSPNTESDIASYVVSFGTASGAQSQTLNVQSSVTRVRMESETALPKGPSTSASTGNPSRFSASRPMP